MTSFKSIIKANVTQQWSNAEMPNYVFLLNADRTPLDLIHPARARELQALGKAAVFRQFPFAFVNLEPRLSY